MRSILVFLSALLIFNVSFSQSPKQLIIDRTIAAFISKESIEIDNKIYTLGKSSTDFYSNASLCQQDTELNIEGLISMTRTGVDFAALDQIHKTSDDHILFFGSIGLESDYSMWLIKTDKFGVKQWEKDLDAIQNIGVTDFIPNNSGGGTILGHHHTNGLNSTVILVDINEDGDTLWTKKITSSIGANIFNPFGYLDNNDNLNIILRNANTSEHLKLSPSGVILSYNQLDDGLSGTLYIRSAFNDGTNTYLAGSQRGGNWTSVLLKLDENDNVEWCKNYDEIERIFDVYKTNNGDLIVNGTTNYGDLLNKAILAKIDTLGNPIIVKSYGKFPEKSVLSSSVLEINNHYYYAGFRAYQQNSVSYQLCLDSNLNSNSCYEKTLELTTTDLYPSFFNLSSPIITSFAPDVISHGPPSISTYFVGASYFTYELDNSIVTDIEVTGDDCGGMCNGEALITATGGNPSYTFEWENGHMGSTIDNLCSGSTISVTTGDQLGCYITDSVTVAQMANITEICMVTVDSSSSKNEIVWDKPISGAIEGFGVYREVVGNYNLIGYVDYDSLSRFVDFTNGVNPNITSYRYKISTFDTCGNESALSNYHETIHLTVNQGAGTDMNCIWDGYEGFPFSYNRILRDSTGTGDWEVVDSVSSSVFTWTDVDAPTVPSRYIIEIVIPNNCDATKAVSYGSTRSNKQSIFGGGGADPLSISQENELSIINVYPNPTKGDFWIEMSSDKPQMVSIDLLDVTGKIVLRKEFEIVGQSKHILKLNDIDPAVYLLKITTENSMTTKTIIKN